MKLGEIVRSIRHPLEKPLAPEVHMSREQRWQFNADGLIHNLTMMSEVPYPFQDQLIRKRERRLTALEFLVAKAGRYGVELLVPPNPRDIYRTPSEISGR